MIGQTEDVLGLLLEPFGALLGAGVSRHSSVPLAGEFQKYVLNSLGAEQNSLERILEAALPFEAFVQVLLDAAERPSILRIFDGGQYNRNHRFLALAASTGLLRIAVTTNFDQLLEDALDPVAPYARYYSDEGLRNVDWAAPELKLVKLHGHVKDLGSLAATVRRVANATLAYRRRKVIHQLLGSEDISTLLVLGYSCSDHFDIRPAIVSAKVRLPRILLVDHVDVPFESASVVPIGSSKYRSFFKGCEGSVVRCDTDQFIQHAWQEVLGTSAPSLVKTTYPWKKWLRAELQVLVNSGLSSYVIGKLLQAAGEYRAANHHFHRIRKTAADQKLRAAALQAIGDNHRDIDAGAIGGARGADGTRRRRLALMAFEAAVVEAKGVAPEIDARATMSQGVVYADHAEALQSNDQLPQAINLYRLAIRKAKRLGDIELKGIGYGNLGIAYKNLGQHDQAIEMQRRAIKIARRVGDMKSVGRAWGNLGIAQSVSGDSKSAIVSYRRALRIARQLRDSRHLGIWLYNLGFDSEKLGRADQAQRYYASARVVFSRLNIDAYVMKCDKKLGRPAN